MTARARNPSLQIKQPMAQTRSNLMSPPSVRTVLYSLFVFKSLICSAIATEIVAIVIGSSRIVGSIFHLWVHFTAPAADQ